MRLSVECAFSHLGKRRATSRKSALCPSASRKSAFCPQCLTEKRILEVSPSRKSALCVGDVDRADCAFPLRCGAREVWSNPPPACGALWRMAQLGKCARATPRQPARRLARGSANLGLSLTSRKSALCQPVGFRMRFSVTPTSQNALFRHDATAECAFP